jgi:YD repeat-containing protein
MNLRRLLAGILLIASSAVLQAQDHPMEAPGFVPNKIFDLHELDSINTFNGNLTVRIPIGPTFHVNGNLSYGLALHYNSHAWRFWADPSRGQFDPSCSIQMQNPAWGNCVWTHAVPQNRPNAAFGWTISLGRLYGPGDSRNRINDGAAGWGSGLTYEDPDGATHTFPYGLHSAGDTLYSTDGSFLRLRASDANLTSVYIDSRDGVTREFEGFAQLGGYGLTKISDATGNHVDIHYSDDGLVWTITDVARTITVTFVNAPPFVSDPYSQGTYLTTVLQSVTMPAPPTPGGQSRTATWTINTTNFPIPKPDGDDFPGTVTVPVITSIQRPADIGGAYTFTLDGTLSGKPAYFDADLSTPGCLLQMTVPTGAVHNWTFDEGDPDAHRRVTSPAIEQPNQVIKRTVYDPATATTDTWTYLYSKSFAQFCINNEHFRARVVTMTRPDKATETFYYSIYPNGGDKCTATDPLGETWVGGDYGLPYTRGTTAGTSLQSAARPDPTGVVPKQYLSTELRDPNGALLQSRYVLYEGDPPIPGNGMTPNPRVVSETTYSEDTTCSSGCPPSANLFTATHHYNYRNFGNYATTVSSGKDVNGTQLDRTSFRNYPKSVGSLWSLDAPLGECVAANDVHNSITDPSDGSIQSTLAYCGPIPGAFITLLNYDAHNLLLGKRILKGSGLTPFDLHSTYTYDVATDPGNTGTNGNLVTEAYAGGDAANLSTTTEFPFPTPTYRINHHHAYSSGGALTGLKSYYDNFNFTLNDFTVDAPSGEITSGRDASGLLTTSYSYDILGRLTGITPPGGSMTTYTYNDSAHPVRIDATTSQVAGGGPLKRASYDYDGLGRLWHEKTYINNGWSTRTTRYDGLSRVWRASQMQATPTECPDTDLTCSETTYDSLGRIHSAKNPDQFVTNYAYVGAAQITRNQPLDQSSIAVWIEQYDGLGRLVSVEDPVHTKGLYTYDAVDHLTVATVKDTLQRPQTRNFVYDNRGLLTSESHPESGQVSYQYDAHGHVLSRSRQQKSAFDLQYDYDGAERPLHVLSRVAAGSDSFRKLKEYVYGDSNSTFNTNVDYLTGRLSIATRHNYQPIGDVQVSEAYHYADDAGRLTNRTTSIFLDSGPVIPGIHCATTPDPQCVLKQSLSQAQGYNELGLTSSMTYPGCDGGNNLPGCAARTWDTINLGYVEARPTLIMAGMTDLAQMTYSENEMLNTIVHSNGIIDTIVKDDKNQMRPKSITVTAPPCAAPAIPSGGSPVSQQIASGATAQLSVTATGTSLTYQWYDGASPIMGAISFLYTTPSLTTSHTYHVVVSNGCGSVTSANASVTVACAISIITQPQDVTVNAGQTSSLAVVASVPSGMTATYQWYQGASGDTSHPAAGAGATSATFSPSPSVTTQYWVRVSQSGGGCQVDSFAATIHVCQPPVILSGPTSQSVTVGTPITFSVSATGDNLTFAWFDQANPANILSHGPTFSPTYASSDVGVHHYHVDVTGCGPGASIDFTVTVYTCDTFLISPPQQTVQPYAAVFTATVSLNGNPANYHYQWYHGIGQNAQPLPDSDSYALTRTLSSPYDAFWCVITSKTTDSNGNPLPVCNGITPKAYFELAGTCPLPTLTVGPTSVEVNPGDQTSFNASVERTSGTPARAGTRASRSPAPRAQAGPWAPFRIPIGSGLLMSAESNMPTVRP